MKHRKKIIVLPILVIAAMLTFCAAVKPTLRSVPEDAPLKLSPGLIKAVGVDGNTGYVRATDLGGTIPSSPEEAVALQLQWEAEGCTGRYIDLYDMDGETVIGRFWIGE